MHTNYLFIFFAAQTGIGTGDSGGQLGCFFHDGFAVLGGDAVCSQHSKIHCISVALHGMGTSRSH